MRWWLAAAAVMMALAGCGSGGGSPAPTPDPAADLKAVSRGVPVAGEVGEATTLWLPAGDEYLLALVSLADPPGDARITVNDGTAVLPMLTRSAARSLPRDRAPRDAGVYGLAPVFRARAEVGSQRSFNLLGAGFNVDVTATLRVVGQHCTLYVDDDTPRADFTDANLSDLASVFDGTLYPSDVALFGQPSDVDGDQRITVLFTPYINQRGYGVFYPGDISSLSGNRTDLLYVLVPQPGAGRDYATLRPALLATLVHELQHLINYAQKAIFHSPSTFEESWLNEALSFNAEQQVELLDTAGGSPENIEFYFRSPERYTLLERTGDYDDGHAGAGYLFVRYLVDRFGTGVLGRLASSGLTGVANVSAATETDFGQLVSDWAAALMLDDGPLPVDALYRIPGFDSHGAYAGGIQLTGVGATVVDATAGEPAFQAGWARGGLRFLRWRPAAGGSLLKLSAAAGERVRVVAVRVPPAGSQRGQPAS